MTQAQAVLRPSRPVIVAGAGRSASAQDREGPAAARSTDAIALDAPDDRLIVIVDRRPLVGQCLLASLRDADAQMRFETFASLGQWHQDTS
ncbi:hypothetical protein ACLBXP_20475, partial [Methylobacterium sp. A54F]